MKKFKRKYESTPIIISESEKKKSIIPTHKEYFVYKEFVQKVSKPRKKPELKPFKPVMDMEGMNKQIRQMYNVYKKNYHKTEKKYNQSGKSLTGLYNYIQFKTQIVEGYQMITGRDQKKATNNNLFKYVYDSNVHTNMSYKQALKMVEAVKKHKEEFEALGYKIDLRRVTANNLLYNDDSYVESIKNGLKDILNISFNGDVDSYSQKIWGSK